MVPTVQFKRVMRRKDYFKILALLKPQKKTDSTHIFVSLIFTVLGIIGSFYFKFLMDSILPNGLVKTLNMLSIGIIVLYILKFY
ncbi:ABC transporter CbaT [Thermoanaerobacter ethanolicus JW 200]|nr:ABC transporter CbaT [Thermoanaerobacter ethanolicus JW 200]